MCEAFRDTSIGSGNSYLQTMRYIGNEASQRREALPAALPEKNATAPPRDQVSLMTSSMVPCMIQQITCLMHVSAN